jgi:hypothetical protein
MGGHRQQGRDLLQGAASVAAVLGGLSAVCFVVGSALIALRLKALGFSSPVLVAIKIPRDYGFAIGLRTVLSNAPFGAIALVLMSALACVFAQRGRMARTLERVSRIRRLGMAAAYAGAVVARSQRARLVIARVRAWPVCRVVLVTVFPLALLIFGHMWILPVGAAAVEAIVWMAVRRARPPAGRGRPAPAWARVTLAVAITAAVAIAKEADRIHFVTFDQAVIVFRHGLSRHDVLGLQQPRRPGPEVSPVYAGTDPLCMDERSKHVCGLLLSEGGEGVTIASLEYPGSPRIVNVPQDEVATTFVVPTKTWVGADEATHRRSPLYCRLPLFKEITRRRCSPSALPTISGILAEGQTLTESHGSWSNGPTRFGYQWETCDGKGKGCSAIRDATRQTYVPTAADVHHTLRIQETASNAGGSSRPSTSRASGVVAGARPKRRGTRT